MNPQVITQSPLASSSASFTPALTRQLTPSSQRGWRLLPRRHELLQALPRLGGAIAVSRNQHAILGGSCNYASFMAEDDPGIPSPLLQHDIHAWAEIWHYHELLNQQIIEGIEFRSPAQMGFHKIIFTDQTDLPYAKLLTTALEDTPLSQKQIAAAIKANHTDGVSCPICAQRAGFQTNQPVQDFIDFMAETIQRHSMLTVLLAYGSHIDRRTFIPHSQNDNGCWHTIKSSQHDLYIRTIRLAQFDQESVDLENLGPCQIATLRTRQDEIIATLIRHG
jgi:hypothetical protein